MFSKLIDIFTKDIGIDLGTTNTLIYVKDRGIVINEPSVVAINNKTQEIIAVGHKAKKMLGKTPPRITISEPINNGIISDFEVTEKMLKYFIDKIYSDSFNLIKKPRIAISIPLHTTEVERKAVEDVVFSIGAKEVFLVEAPIAAAIGIRLPVEEASTIMIVNIGGGTAEVAVISLGGIVNSKSLKFGGNELDKNIIDYVRDHFNLFIGSVVAEDTKIKIGSATPLADPISMLMRGRDFVTGLPKEVLIGDSEIRLAMSNSLHQIIDNIKSTIETTSPELVADIYENGIILTGGSVLLKGLDKLLIDTIKIPVIVTEDPLTAVVRGLGILFDKLPLLEQVSAPPSQ